MISTSAAEAASAAVAGSGGMWVDFPGGRALVGAGGSMFIPDAYLGPGRVTPVTASDEGIDLRALDDGSASVSSGRGTPWPTPPPAPQNGSRPEAGT